jgi:hypothetical protein
MDILEFVNFAKRTSGGTFSVSNKSYMWEISHKSYVSGFQVGVGNLDMIPLRRDGEDIDDETLLEKVMSAVSDLYYDTTYNGGVERSLGLWVENESDGGATLYIDTTVWVADKLSANIVGAVMCEKEIYDWENDKCLPVIPLGK